jgi:single-strand DNA-binding protein
MKEFIMAFVRVEQRNAHLAGAVQLAYVNGREGKVAKAVLTAISNTRRGSGEAREDEPTAIQWTLWGKQAENAHLYLGKGSHVNVVGRVQNNHYEKDGATVYALAFTAEEIDYLDNKGEADARRAREGSGEGGGDGSRRGAAEGATPAPHRAANGSAGRSRKPPAATAGTRAYGDADVPF